MPIDKGFEVVILVVMFVMFYFQNGLTNDKKRGKAYSKRIYIMSHSHYGKHSFPMPGMEYSHRGNGIFPAWE